MTDPEQPQPSAKETYSQDYTEVCDMMLRIINKLYTDRDNLQEPNWANVGDQKHVKEALKEICAFMGI